MKNVHFLHAVTDRWESDPEGKPDSSQDQQTCVADYLHKSKKLFVLKM